MNKLLMLVALVALLAVASVPVAAESQKVEVFQPEGFVCDGSFWS